MPAALRPLTDLRRAFAQRHLGDHRWHEVTAAGVRCEALEVGEGPPLVLVHGGIDACTQWIPILPRLAEQHRCFAVERPSNGASEEFDYAGHTGDRHDHVALVVGDLLDGVGVERAPIVANSMGGLFSLGFAVRHPERVERLVMAGCPAGHEPGPLPLPIRLMKGRVTGRVISRLTKRGGPEDARRIHRQLVAAHPERLSDEYLELAAATGRHNADAWRRFLQWAVDGRSVHPHLPSKRWADETPVPITYVWGDQDAFGSPESGRQLARSVGADFVEIRDAGHLPWLDQPDQTLDAILGALRPTDSPP